MGSVDGFMALPACSLQLRRSDMKRWSHGGFTMRDTMTLRPEGRVVLKQNNLFEEREAVAVSETAIEPDTLQTCLLPILGEDVMRRMERTDDGAQGFSSCWLL